MEESQKNMEERLYKIFANVNDWLKFAEAKNIGLLTLNLALSIGLIQLFSAKDCDLNKWVFYLSFGANFISFIIALFSVSPLIGKIERNQFFKTPITFISNIIDKEIINENIHFYGYLKDFNVADFEEKFLQKISTTDYQFNDFEKELSSQIIYNSIITSYKYQLFKLGCFITLIGVILSVIVLMIF
ncbi:MULTISPECIES: hypothetical protein [unclassified Empedobacter]|uniref:hypothetical protein n=1 Tax=unclassified Empedobacter TaxID=2643773 RepID=UPI0025BA046F|nr:MULTISPECIES: hypothetical protein [unclassified Empedobacter]